MACIVGVVGVVSGGVEDTIKLPAHLRQICASRWVCGHAFRPIWHPQISMELRHMQGLGRAVFIDMGIMG